MNERRGQTESHRCHDDGNFIYMEAVLHIKGVDEVVDLPWGKGPPMIRKRVATCAAFVDNKMYLFGNIGEIYEYQPGKLPSWWPCHGLSLWISVIFLLKLNSVEEQCFDVEGHTTLVDPNGSKKILTYSLYTKELLSYDMDGIMYGVGFMRLDSNTIYAYDYLNPNSNSPKPVIDVSNTPGRVGPSGLIFINKDTLCVLTGSHYLAGRLITHLCRLVCSKYRISKKPNKQSGGVDVTAELVSASNYFLKDVNSFRVTPPVLKKKHRPRGKKKKRNEGKDVVATECEGTCIFRNFLRGKEQRK